MLRNELWKIISSNVYEKINEVLSKLWVSLNSEHKSKKTLSLANKPLVDVELFK